MEELTDLIIKLQSKLDEQREEIRDMKQSIPLTINNNIDSKFATLESKYNTLEKVVENQERRIQNLERSIRKKNLVFFGVAENEKNYQDLQQLILQVINGNMGFSYNSSNLEEVRRLGRHREEGKIRPVIVTLCTVGMKIDLLKNKKKLNDTLYYIKEDFPPEVLEERKNLKKQLIEERSKGRKAYLKYNKIIIIPDDNKKPNFSTSQTQYKKRALSESPEVSVKNVNTNNVSGHRKKQATKKSNSNIYEYITKNQSNKHNSTYNTDCSPINEHSNNH